MSKHGHSYESLSRIVGIAAQSLHYGAKRGTFGRLTVAKLVAVTGLEYEDFLLPEERKELRELQKKVA